MNALTPFYRLSSSNRVGGRMHPIVTRRMNKILDMWMSFMTREEIAKSLDVSLDCVARHIERAKRRGDPRASRPNGINRLSLQKSVRRNQMKTMRKAGFSPSEIAKRLQVNVRLVQMRLKEEA